MIIIFNDARILDTAHLEIINHERIRRAHSQLGHRTRSICGR